MSEDDVVRSDIWLTEKAHKNALEKQKETYESEINKLKEEIQKRDGISKASVAEPSLLGKRLTLKKEIRKFDDKQLAANPAKNTLSLGEKVKLISVITIFTALIAFCVYYKHTKNVKEQAMREVALAQETPTTEEQLIQRFNGYGMEYSMSVEEKEIVGRNFILKTQYKLDTEYLNVTKELYLRLKIDDNLLWVLHEINSENIRINNANVRKDADEKAAKQSSVNLEELRKFTVFKVVEKYEYNTSFIIRIYDEKDPGDKFGFLLRIHKEVFDIMILGHTIGEQLPAIEDAFKRASRALVSAPM